MPFAFVTAVALAAQATTAAPIVTGQVLDPGNLPVAGAMVRVECGALTSSARSDAAGRFEVRAPNPAAECVIEVLRDGFESWSARLVPGRPIKARLSLAVHHETLTVHGSGDTPLRPTSGVSDGDLLRQMTNDPDQMIHIARAMAGTSDVDQRVYVDGSPREVLPTAERVNRVAVNPDPYSAAFGDLDGARIEIETSPLSRAWRYTLNASPGSLSAEHPLGAGHQWITRSVVAGLSGPVPGTPLAWSAGIRSTRRDQQSPLLSPSDTGGSTSTAGNREQLNAVYATASYERGATRVIADLNVRDDRAFASGAGGLVLPEASADVEYHLVELNGSFRRDGALTVASSGTLRLNAQSSRARSAGQGFTAAGSSTGGGAALASGDARNWFVWWSGRVAGSARGRVWRAGATLNASTAAYNWIPNPLGVLNTAPDGSRALFTEFEIGSGASRHSERVFAGYGEMQVARGTQIDVTGGLRVDSIDGDLSVSPRISGALNVARTTVTFGAGRFVEALDAATLLPLYARASGATTHVASDDRETMMGITRVAIAPRRQWLASIGASRPFGGVDLAGEYRWSRTANAPSLAREVAGAAWIEAFGSDALQHQEEARIRLRIGRGQRTLLPYYTWRRATDTADGWWGAAASAADPFTWAPTAGIAAHEGGFVLSLKAPGAISASLVGALSSGRAMDLVFAPGSLREALTAPLRPASRNSATGPATASVQLFASRPLKFDALRVRGRVGVQVTNVLGRRNVLAPINVLNAPLYGRPTDAGAARSLSVWLTLGQ